MSTQGGDTDPQVPNAAATEISAMRALDQTYDVCTDLRPPHGLLGYGTFSTVLLGKKRSSGRLVALKVFNRSDSYAAACYTRQVDALLQLEASSSSSNSDSDIQEQRGAASILYMRDWLESSGNDTVSCIVSQYASRGTLLDEIRSRQRNAGRHPFYTERRIRWYALQIIDAVAFMHSRNIMHWNISSSRILIDGDDGKLILSGLGSAMVVPSCDAPLREPPQGTFYDRYGAPEVFTAMERNNWALVQPDKVDGFAVGCILLELVCCTPLEEFEGETIGRCLRRANTFNLLNLPQVKLPWLPPVAAGAAPVDTNTPRAYTHDLDCVLRSFLETHPRGRATPREVSASPYSSLRHCPDILTAAENPLPGAPLTVDNIQLGMFVQRGRDWEPGNNDDGGLGSIGIVVKLDVDALYTEVAFPSEGGVPEAICCRIGANQKYELKVGPTVVNDFIANTDAVVSSGRVESSDPTTISCYVAGTMLNPNCQVVHVAKQPQTVGDSDGSPGPTTASFFMAPTVKTHDIPTLNVAELPAIENPQPDLVTRNGIPMPAHWDPSARNVVMLESGEERQAVLDTFYGSCPGSQNCYTVVAVRSVQFPRMWNAYAKQRGEVAAQNWSLPNAATLFHGTARVDPATLLDSPQGIYANSDWFFQNAFVVDRSPFGFGETRTVVCSIVALGRVEEEGQELQRSLPYHSVLQRESTDSTARYRINNALQAYPAYFITYRTTTPSDHQHVASQASLAATTGPPQPRRVVRANRPARASFAAQAQSTVSTPVATQMAVVNPSSQIPASLNPARVGAATYHTPPPPSRQLPSSTTSASSPGSANRVAVPKQCVICMERTVCKVLVPCGHPCLCSVCSSEQALDLLRRNCPVCRQFFSQVIRLFGTVVEEDES